MKSRLIICEVFHLENALEVIIAKKRYVCEGGTLKVYKQGLFGSDSMLFHCDISDIEILYYDSLEKPAIFFASPDMEQNHACYVTKDPDESIRRMHDYFMEHGAAERLMGRMKAALAKHSLKELEKKTEKSEKRAIMQKRAGCKVQTEEKYTCVKCGNSWYVSDTEVLRNFANFLHGSFYSLNQLKQVDKCPQCGSTATQHKTVKFWVDKKGNAVDYEE